ncbi:hypothetical protein E8E14_012927, partial [Neopestalotiopsis sp. 37M]
MMRSFAATGPEAIVIRKWQSVSDVSAMIGQLRLPNIECLGPPEPPTGGGRLLTAPPNDVMLEGLDQNEQNPLLSIGGLFGTQPIVNPKRLPLARLRQLFGQEQRCEVEKGQLRSLLRWFAKHIPDNWAPAPPPEAKAGHEYATGPRYSQKFASGTAIKAAFSAQESAATKYLSFYGDESLLGVVILSEEVAAEDDRTNVLASFDRLTLLDSLVPRSWPALTLSMQRRMTRGSSMWLLAARYAG